MEGNELDGISGTIIQVPTAYLNTLEKTIDRLRKKNRELRKKLKELTK